MLNIRQVSQASEDDTNHAVAAAKAAFPVWRDLSPSDRGAYLRKLADLIRKHHDEFARLESFSTGKPVSAYIDGAFAADTFAYFAEAGWTAQGTSSLNTPGSFNLTLKQPYGVIAAIIPWNVPLAFFAFKVAPALAAGNTVVLKSNEKAPLTVSQAKLFYHFFSCWFLTPVPVCSSGKTHRRNRLSTRRYKRAFRVWSTSWKHLSISHGCALHQLYGVFIHRPEDPSGCSSIKHESCPYGARREVAGYYIR